MLVCVSSPPIPHSFISPLPLLPPCPLPSYGAPMMHIQISHQPNQRARALLISIAMIFHAVIGVSYGEISKEKGGLRTLIAKLLSHHRRKPSKWLLGWKHIYILLFPIVLWIEINYICIVVVAALKNCGQLVHSFLGLMWYIPRYLKIKNTTTSIFNFFIIICRYVPNTWR